jgi:hypothetical protein
MMAYKKSMAWIVVFTLLVLTSTISVAAPPTNDPRLVRAKVECASGNVPAGIRLLAEVYADTNFTVLVFNQGRCYEQNNLREQAIARFEEFLRIDKTLTPEDAVNIRRRIDGLQKVINQNAKLFPPPSETGLLPNLGPSSSELSKNSLMEKPTLPEPEEGPPTYKRWWFWTGIGALIAGGITTAVILSSKQSTTLTCDPGVLCPK